MRGSTRTLKHIHIHLPSKREVKDWIEKVFTRERSADVALTLTVILLCGWLVYCLGNALQNYTFTM